MQERTDADLVTLARADDTYAFGLLMERYHIMALSIALRLVPEKETARDLVQESMLQAYLSLNQLRDEARFKNWFYGIVLNVCRTWLREQRTSVLSLEALEENWQVSLSAELVDPQEVAEERELHCLVQQAVRVLTPKNRMVALLFYYEHLSIQEIATSLDISLTVVKSRLHKGRKQLKKQLKAVYPEMEHTAPRKQRRKRMIRVTLAKVIPHEPRTLVMLLDEQGQRVFPLWLGAPEGYALFRVRNASLQHVPFPEASTIDFASNLLSATGSAVEEVRIEALEGNLLYAKVFLRNESGLHEVKARLGEALPFAVQTGSSISVAEEVFDRLNMSLPPENGNTLDQRLDMVVSRLSKLGPTAMSAVQHRVKSPQNLRFEHGLQHWDLRVSHLHDSAGTRWQDYECGTDANGPHGAVSGYLKAMVPEPAEYGMLRQAILADDYRGKQLQISGDVKTEGVEQRAGLYLRVVGQGGTLSIDEMQDRPIRGTSDWTRYETTLKVPEGSAFILFGLILYGKGQVWLANVQLEAVGEDKPTPVT